MLWIICSKEKTSPASYGKQIFFMALFTKIVNHQNGLQCLLFVLSHSTPGNGLLGRAQAGLGTGSRKTAARLI